MMITTFSTDRTFKCRSVAVNRPNRTTPDEGWNENIGLLFIVTVTLKWEWKWLCKKNALLFSGSMVYYCKFCFSSPSQMIHKSYTRSIDIRVFLLSSYLSLASSFGDLFVCICFPYIVLEILTYRLCKSYFGRQIIDHETRTHTHDRIHTHNAHARKHPPPIVVDSRNCQCNNCI